MIPSDLREASITRLQSMLASGEATAQGLAQTFLDSIESIDRAGPELRSVIETNRAVMDIAASLDEERRRGKIRGPLHGIPILIKDNIDTFDTMATTAGSLALVASRPKKDAFVVSRLRQAGAVLLGKTNLSEWANFRSTHSSSGWSGRGGQTRNPYVLDRSPCGSSSGSAAAIAAGLATASLGTETDGSILCPGGFCGVVGIKPTVGLTSRSGVIPISHTQDTVGPFARSVSDAALVLDAIAGTDPADPVEGQPVQRASRSYSTFLDPAGLRGARIGVPRNVFFGYSSKADAVVERAIEALREGGADIIDPADIATAEEMQKGETEFEMMLHEFKADLNLYLTGRQPSESPRTLTDIIAFNESHAAEELKFFGQEILIQAEQKGPLTDSAYVAALAENKRLSRTEGIDRIMDQHGLDAMVMPTAAPAFTIDLVNGDHYGGGSSQPAAMAGYPAITVPAGFSFDLPVGVTFTGRAYSEPVLIRLAYAYEQLTQERRPPRFLPTLRLA